MIDFDRGIRDNIKLHYSTSSFDEKNLKIKIGDDVIEYPDINQVIVGKVLKSSDTIISYIIQ
jgi:hypothetical protein